MIYPVKIQFLKFTTSFSILIVMVGIPLYFILDRSLFYLILTFLSYVAQVLMVFISVGGVIVYRVIMSVDFCTNATPTECLIVTTIASSLLNAISILVLGKVG